MKHEAEMSIYKLVNLSHNSGLDDERALDDVKHNLFTNKLMIDIYNSFYHLFINSADYALALWFHYSKCSKGNINQFFCDERLAAI